MNAPSGASAHFTMGTNGSRVSCQKPAEYVAEDSVRQWCARLAGVKSVSAN